MVVGLPPVPVLDAVWCLGANARSIRRQWGWQPQFADDRQQYGPGAPLFSRRLRGLSVRALAAQKVALRPGRRRAARNIHLGINAMGQRGGVAMIPTKRNRIIQLPVDAAIHSLSNMVERCFNKLKSARGLATRYDTIKPPIVTRLHLRHLNPPVDTPIFVNTS
jgi:hypothetical protein